MDNSSTAFQLLKEQIDTSYLYYKSLLSCSEQQTYNTIVNGLLQYKRVIRVQKQSFRTVERIIEMIYLDIPGVFYFKDFTFRQCGELREIIPNYRFSREKTANTLLAVFNTIRGFIDHYINCNDNIKGMAVHNLLCSSVKYIDNQLDSDHEFVGPLLFRSGVCEGISKAAKLLFDLLGVNSILIRGRAVSHDFATQPDSHIWNMVKIGNLFYHLDITFDLSLMEYHAIRYDYYCLSDTEIRNDHFFSKNIPQCEYNWSYYIKNGLYFTEIQLFDKYFNSMIKTNKTDLIFQIPNNRFTINLSVLKESIEQIISNYPKICSYELYHNKNSGVCHLHLAMR